MPNEKTCDIGPNEKCKSCDLNQTEFCDECNDGYYLSETDKTKCKKCSRKNCKKCPNDICLHCMDDNSKINYPLLTEEEALEITLKNMKIAQYGSGYAYCHYYNDSEEISPKPYYVWNSYKRKMIEISGSQCYISNNLMNSISSPISNEYLQAKEQGYKFTYRDHIYEKNHKIYRYKELPAPYFKEIIDRLLVQSICEPCEIGIGTLCKECDKNEPEYCGSCNNGYCLTFDDRTKCRKRQPNEFCFENVNDI